jgi:predicted DsbA family dithiol-disulfide isomerase
MDAHYLTGTPPRPPLELDLIADFTCPWSFLGKRSLDRALGNLYGAPVRALRWHGFPVQPTPSEHRTWREYLAARLSDGVSVEYAHRSLKEAGRALGIHFDFDRLVSVPDTHEAHRLVRLAAREERQGDVVDALFVAYFEQGRDIGDREVLLSIARECGLSENTIAAFENLDEGREEVEAEEQRLRGLGVAATPNLLINGRILVPGPADVPTYVVALDQALFPELNDKKVSKRKLH